MASLNKLKHINVPSTIFPPVKENDGNEARGLRKRCAALLADHPRKQRQTIQGSSVVQALPRGLNRAFTGNSGRWRRAPWECGSESDRTSARGVDARSAGGPGRERARVRAQSGKTAWAQHYLSMEHCRKMPATRQLRLRAAPAGRLQQGALWDDMLRVDEHRAK